jgi:hypothetical protein
MMLPIATNSNFQGNSMFAITRATFSAGATNVVGSSVAGLRKLASVSPIISEIQKTVSQWAENWLSQTQSNIGSQRRGIVTVSAQEKLGNIHPSLIQLPLGVSAYQKRGGCVQQATEIIRGANLQYAPETVSIPSGETEKKGDALLQRLMETLDQVAAGVVQFMEGVMDTTRVKSADQLLDIYQKKGPFILRGPHLSDPTQELLYEDHAIAVMAAVRVRIDGQEKIGFCTFDCNDKGTDKETTAARQRAAKLGKELCELTPEEVEGLGTGRRRIRPFDADPVVAHLFRTTMGIWETHGVHMKSEVTFMTHGEPLLTDEQHDQLKVFFTEHWHEVEKYTEVTYPISPATIADDKRAERG